MSNYARKDVRFPRELAHELELLKKDVRQKTGLNVSTNDLIVQIVRQFFEKAKKLSPKAEEHLLLKIEEVKRDS